MDTTAREKISSLIYEALHDVYDPELGVNVVDLGLIYGIDVNEDGHVTIMMTFTVPGCPMHETIGDGVETVLQTIPGVTNGEIHLLWDPPWEPSRMTEEGRRMLGF